VVCAPWTHYRGRGLRVLRPCPRRTVPRGHSEIGCTVHCHIPDERVYDMVKQDSGCSAMSYTVPTTERLSERSRKFASRRVPPRGVPLNPILRSSFNTPSLGRYSNSSRVARSLSSMVGQSRGCCDIDEIAYFIRAYTHALTDPKPHVNQKKADSGSPFQPAPALMPTL
jgi:hypothetical protein